MNASEMHVYVLQSNFPLYVECGLNDFEISIPTSVDERDVKALDPPTEVSFAKLSNDHPLRIDFFHGSHELFDMYISLIDLANEEVDHLDVADFDRDNEVGINSENNHSFC